MRRRSERLGLSSSIGAVVKVTVYSTDGTKTSVCILFLPTRGDVILTGCWDGGVGHGGLSSGFGQPLTDNGGGLVGIALGEFADTVHGLGVDLALHLRRYAESIEASPARLQQVEDRLALLERGTGDDAGFKRARSIACRRPTRKNLDVPATCTLFGRRVESRGGAPRCGVVVR